MRVRKSRRRQDDSVVVLVGPSCAGKTTLLSRRELRATRVVEPEHVYHKLHQDNPGKPSKVLATYLRDTVVVDVLGGGRPVVLETNDYSYVDEIYTARVALLYATLHDLAKNAAKRQDQRRLPGVLNTYTDLFTCKIERATGPVVDVITREEVGDFLRAGQHPPSSLAETVARACRKLGLGSEPAAVYPAVAHDLLLDDPASMARELADLLKQ